MGRLFSFLRYLSVIANLQTLQLIELHLYNELVKKGEDILFTK